MVNHLFEELSRLPQVEAIALGGSRATEVFDPASDYDVYLYCTAPVPVEVRREILSRYCSVLEIGNHYWESEDNCTMHSGVDIDILYRNLDDFCRDLASVVEEFRPHNGYTTCMWHNLNTCKTICDKHGRLAQAKARFAVPYPAQLRKNIITRGRSLLEGTLPAYRAQIAKAAGRGDLVSVNHRVAAFLESYFDVIFALNRQTHPGEKRLVKLCKATCPLLPADFEKNLNALFAGMYQGPETLLPAIDAIVSRLDALLAAQEDL